MLNEFVYEGKWWLEGYESNKVSGRLTFKPKEEICLELFEPFEDIKYDPKLIHGIANNKNITLYNNFLSKRTHSYGSEYYSVNLTYISDRIFIGKHYKDINNIYYNYMTFSFTYLTRWLNDRVFEDDFKYNEITGEKNLKINYNPLEKREIKINNIKTSLFIDSGFKTNSDYNNYNIEHNSIIKIKPDQAKSLKWYDKIREQLQNFLTLLIGEAVYPTKIKGFSGDITGAGTKKSIKIYHLINNTRTKNNIHPHIHMIFSYPQIKENLNHCLEQWFEKAEELKSVFNLLFGTIYHSETARRFTFLSLLQALEAYFRQEINGGYMSGEEYKKQVLPKLKEGIPDNINNDFRQSIKSSMKYNYEYSLRKKIDIIIEQVFEAFIENYINSKSEFKNKITDTRNYFTHYTNELKEKAIKEEDLFPYILKLRTILFGLLFKELGYDNEKIYKRIENSKSNYIYNNSFST